MSQTVDENAAIPEREKKSEDVDTNPTGVSTTPVPKEQPIPAPSQSAPPEGGTQAWLTVAGAWLVQFCTFGYSNAFGVYQDFYVREYLTNHTSSEISWIGSMQVMLVLSLGLFTGQLYDRGYFHHLMIGGSVLFAFCLFMLSLSHPNQYYQVFLSQGLGVGLAIGMTYIPSLGVISHYFQRRRALVMGIAASGSSLGGVIHPIMLNKLFHGPSGFQKGVRYSAAMNLILLFIANCLMRTRLPPRKGGNMFAGTSAFARDPPYVLAVMGAFLVILGLFFPIFFLQLDAITHNLDPNFAFYSLAILNAASVFGRVIPSLIAQTTGVFNTIVVCTAICGILVFSMFGVTTVGAVIVFAILFGFFSGAYVSLLAPMLTSLARDVTEIGSRMGICYTFTGIGSLVGTPIAGALLTPTNMWWRPIIFSGTTMTVGAGFLLAARMLVAARKGKRAV
ncbi:MFS monocarboxylate transporter [Heterobasidion irregulare TC 32-1]|uniref:MFS monocarboxylate transporter n=1 Tax=Heterobasidion irregulare (strain TC 32-1) TaxID=747525 RepID=W4JQQ0_HETIT|nr:MFS monocarboxylate transporter [Heterobasidion irregulare TC 32-1]ETW75410.1 MFS monocarboxylate transporter [Heterobasidion irregulare TC 32-1]